MTDIEMTDIVGILICVTFIVLFIMSIILMFDNIITSFKRLEKAEKERHDILIKLIENMVNIHSQK